MTEILWFQILPKLIQQQTPHFGGQTPGFHWSSTLLSSLKEGLWFFDSEDDTASLPKANVTKASIQSDEKQWEFLQRWLRKAASHVVCGESTKNGKAVTLNV